MRSIIAALAVSLALVHAAVAQTKEPSQLDEFLQNLGNAITKAGARGEVVVRMTDVVPTSFNKSGQSIGCRIKMTIANGTKYHVDKVTFRFGNAEIAIPEMVANTATDDFYEFNFDNGGECWRTAEFIRTNTRKVVIFDCSMRGIPEGDCQDLIRIVSGIDETLVAGLRNLEAAKVAQAQAADARERERNKAALSGLGR
jgi:hypothetical protein